MSQYNVMHQAAKAAGAEYVEVYDQEILIDNRTLRFISPLLQFGSAAVSSWAAIEEEVEP